MQIENVLKFGILAIPMFLSDLLDLKISFDQFFLYFDI